MEGGWLPIYHINKGRKSSRVMRRVPEATGGEAPKVEGQVVGKDVIRLGAQSPRAALGFPPPCVRAQSCPPQEVENCRNELTESDHRKLRNLPGISWPGRKAVGAAKLFHRWRNGGSEVSGSPYSGVIMMAGPTLLSLAGAPVTQCSQGCSPREHVHAQLCSCFEESMSLGHKSPRCFVLMHCFVTMSSVAPFIWEVKALEASSTFKL